MTNATRIFSVVARCTVGSEDLRSFQWCRHHYLLLSCDKHCCQVWAEKTIEKHCREERKTCHKNFCEINTELLAAFPCMRVLQMDNCSHLLHTHLKCQQEKRCQCAHHYLVPYASSDTATPYRVSFAISCKKTYNQHV